MFAEWRRQREEKRAKEKAIAESQYWKRHPQLRVCLQAMRGSCTVAPVEMHEAAIAVVNIALREDTWTRPERPDVLAEDFLGNTVYIVWDDEKLPVLKAPWIPVKESIPQVTAVARQTFLVSETLDRIIRFDQSGEFCLYSVT